MHKVQNKRIVQNPKSKIQNSFRKRARGQAIVIIALALLLLIAVVGLAVDGGATYALRRKAQNASDAAALAGGHLMVKYYEAMVQRSDVDVPGFNTEEDAVRTSINAYMVANGVDAGTVKAYFVSRNKQIVTVSQGEDRGQGHCGSAAGLGRPCEVGENGEIPWQRGVVGVTLISTAEMDSIFAGVMGWDTLSSAARSTAFIFVPTTTGDINVQPIALFRDPQNYREFELDEIYILLDGDDAQGGGNWGWVNWNGLGSSRVAIQDWINCGFNPGSTQAQWLARCPGASINSTGYGPTQHFITTPPAGTYLPAIDPVMVRYLRYGAGMTGWWVQGSSGAVNSNCTDFVNRVNQGGEFDYYNGVEREGVTFYIPIFDNVYNAGGSTGLRYHLRQIVKFFVRKPLGNNDPDPDISCRPRVQPTSTATCIGGVCPTSTPSSGGGGQTHWFIRGKAKSFFNNLDSGELGDLRSSLNPIVALDR